MPIRALIVFLFLGVFVSCAPREEENDPEPAYILPEARFLDVLTDCYLGEGAAGINVKNVTGARFDSAYIFNPFKDHGISRQQFDTTIEWYSQHPKKLKEIYNKLLANLSRMVAFGNTGASASSNSNKYIGRDARFFFTESKADSIERASAKAGYSLKIPYHIP